MKIKTIISFCAFVGILISGCRKDPVTDTTLLPGNAQISFLHTFGDSLLDMTGVRQYQTASDDYFACTVFRYYISNVSLVDANGNTWHEPESYHLIDAANPNRCGFVLHDIPSREFVSMRFMIGVDSARNVSGVQSGDLDPALDMFWGWNTGYIMAKLEGTSPQSTANDNMVIYHIGGYGGIDAAQRWVTIPFGSTALSVKSDNHPAVRLKTDVAEWFTNPNPFGIGDYSVIVDLDHQAAAIADNYADMISLISVEN